MPHTTQTQSFTVTLSSEELARDLQNNLAAVLAQLTHSRITTNFEPDGAPEIASVETDSERSQREAAEQLIKRAATAQRDAKLLELKGWLFGENEKKKLGLPSEWEQGRWGTQTACGTTACIAGKTVLDAGGRFIKADYGNNWNDRTTFTLPEADEEVFFSFVQKPDGESVKVQAWAGELLELTNDQRLALFEGDNTYEMAAAIIDVIISGEGDVYEVRNKARASSLHDGEL